MKHYEHITAGFELITPDGYAVAESYNGSIVTFTEHVTDPETDTDIKTRTIYLTRQEIARDLKEQDGHEHNIVWDEPSEEVVDAVREWAEDNGVGSDPESEYYSMEIEYDNADQNDSGKWYIPATDENGIVYELVLIDGNVCIV